MAVTQQGVVGDEAITRMLQELKKEIEGSAPYTPTLQSAPTSSTTTYTRDGQTVDFEIGQFCRVANQGSPTGYDVYQLVDLVTENNTTAAVWRGAVALTNNEIDAIWASAMAQ